MNAHVVNFFAPYIISPLSGRKLAAVFRRTAKTRTRTWARSLISCSKFLPQKILRRGRADAACYVGVIRTPLRKGSGNSRASSPPPSALLLRSHSYISKCSPRKPRGNRQLTVTPGFSDGVLCQESWSSSWPLFSTIPSPNMIFRQVPLSRLGV